MRLRNRRLSLGPGTGPHQPLEITRTGQMMHRQRRDQKCRIGEPIHGPDSLTVSNRVLPLMKVGHQQRRGKPNQFPPEKQRFDRPRQRRNDHPQQEHGEQHKEPSETRLAMQVATGEGTDRAAQHKGQDRERNRQPIEDELQVKVKMLLRNDDPVADLDRHVTRPDREHQHDDGDRREQSDENGGFG